MVPRTDAAATRWAAAALVLTGLLAHSPPVPGAHATGESAPLWWWPLASFRISAPYVAPPGPYAAGHRGIDLVPLGTGSVRAPASGTVAFSGPVAGRGILTIDHGDGYVTTLEPVDSALPIGTTVGRGDDVATLSLGGHTEPGSLHFGVRFHGEYVNPMLLLGGIPRAVLLPCC